MKGGLTWLFDLDNTLHDARPHVFPHINRSMTEYIMRHLDLDEADAGSLRRRYWQAYGATLLGLMRHHDVDPHHFLWHTHQMPDLERMVVAEAGLRHCLKRLRGRKILFSNSPLHYAQAVLDVLGIGELFDAVYTIERTRFQPKPSLAGFLGSECSRRARRRHASVCSRSAPSWWRTCWTTWWRRAGWA